MTDNETKNEVVDVEASPEEFEINHHDEDHDDAHLAARALKIIGILAVGGVLALWLGPKVAPILPSGMAPVANWLAPGGAQNKAEIASLQAALAELPEAVSVYEIEAMIAGGISTKTAALSTRIDGLGDGGDTRELSSRLAALELKTDGLRAELSTLLTRLSDVSQAGGEVSAETAARLAGFAAANEGLKAEIEILASRLDTISANAEQVSVVEGNAQAARDAANIRNSLNTIDVALSAGLPFASALAELEGVGGVDIPSALVDASGGVVTMAALRNDFPDAAHAAIRASIMASAGDGMFATIGAFTKAQIAGRSLTPQTGIGPDAVLSRAEEALKQNDLVTALAEIDALPAAAMPSEARGPMGDWVADATARQDALDAFEALQASLATE